MPLASSRRRATANTHAGIDIHFECTPKQRRQQNLGYNSVVVTRDIHNKSDMEAAVIVGWYSNRASYTDGTNYLQYLHITYKNNTMKCVGRTWQM